MARKAERASREGLERSILSALRLALDYERLDVADHLLKALEVLTERGQLGSSLDDAYTLVTNRNH